MSKNTQTETTQKSQAVKKEKKSKVPTGKITLIKDTEARKKAREEQYQNFRIAALRRRCKRMGIEDKKTEELVEKLKEQLKAPKEYSILVICYKDGKMMLEALKNAKINYKFHGDTFVWIDGNQEVLAKIREIAPVGAKIHPYAKKMESVIPKNIQKKEKKPSNNTAEKKAAANPKRPMHMAVKSTRHFHRLQKGRLKKLREVAKKAKKVRKATTIHMKQKKATESLKKAA